MRPFALTSNMGLQVFHEDSFRSRYSEMVEYGQITRQDDNFVWLCALVIALGSHYLALSPLAGGQVTYYQQLSKDLLVAIEQRFLQIVGCSTLESVQICVLLGSFLLFNGRPNAGLGISGSGVKIAQVIGLHRESLWKSTHETLREEKRRTWWTLEVFDK